MSMQKIKLPVDEHIDEILSAIDTYDSVILSAPPGSGKTTRVPAALFGEFKKIIVLVPKRIAAISAAGRIAEENNWTLGREVGYQVRFENKSEKHTQIVFMTEGVFIKKLQDPELWTDLGLIIFDEFHERSSQLDLALGLTLERQILEEKIKIMIMSATLETTRLRSFLSNPKLIEVKATPHPLEIIKCKKSQRLKIDQGFSDVLMESLNAASTRSKNDILIFLPGLSEIRFIERAILAKFRQFEICVLHGSISLGEQKNILRGKTESKRRIILATNIAESSLTIPGVDCVIDSGLVKKSVTEAKIGFKKLELSRISLFSAKQRAGRAARTGPGVCYQLWHESDERSMPEAIIPELLFSDLLEESLTLLSLGVADPDRFSWLDRPKKKFSEAIAQLHAWGLVNTEKGRIVQSGPLDLERSVLFVDLSLSGFQETASRFMAFLETTNFERLNEFPDFESFGMPELGSKIENQLNRMKIKPNSAPAGLFKEQLIKIFFRDFPHRIAKRKEKNQAISSLGRGVELLPFLTGPDSDYFLLFSGRDLTDAVTRCEFAIGFSVAEFEKYSSESIRQIIEIKFDLERRRLFKIEKKVAGLFVVSEAAKVFIDEAKEPALFASYFEKNFGELLTHHEHYKNYVTKIGFLKKKTDSDFTFLEILPLEAFNAIGSSVHSINGFFEMNLFEILLHVTPENVKKFLMQLPGHFTLPSGKIVSIDYESEQAPKISARIQELYGQSVNPTVLGGKVRMTIELLAPNYRPTQITSQLENFWQTSYFEIRKELRARYPRHAWPDDPNNYKHEPKKGR